MEVELYVLWMIMILKQFVLLIVSASAKCSACTKYRTNLRSMYHRWSKSQQNMQDPTRYLNTTQKKAKMEKLKKRAHVAEEAVGEAPREN